MIIWRIPPNAHLEDSSIKSEFLVLIKVSAVRMLSLGQPIEVTVSRFEIVFVSGFASRLELVERNWSSQEPNLT